MIDYREETRERVESELNIRFHLPIKLINEEGTHPNSFRVFVNGIKSPYVLSYESMIYFKEEDINSVIVDIYTDYKLGEYVPDLTEYTYSERKITK